MKKAPVIRRFVSFKEDIAIVYRFQLEHRENADATVLVTNQMLQNYGITAEQLMADAAVSAPQRNPVSLRSLAEVLSEMSGGMILPEDVGAPPLMVATVPGTVNGAGVMGYPDFFKDAAEQIGGSYFILPSFVHEILLLADDGSMSAQELSVMVSAVNSQEVMPEEQLGSEAYHYDAQAQVFEKASAYEERIMEEREMIADAMPGVIHEGSAVYTAESVHETISVLMMEPGKYPREIEIGTELEDLQAAARALISGYHKFEERRKQRAAARSARKSQKPTGKQTVKQLIGQNQGVSSIDIAKTDLKGFEKYARTYGVDYAITKDKSSDVPKYLCSFKARDADAMTAAFNAYSAEVLKRQKAPSVLKQLAKLKAYVKALPVKTRTKEKERDLNR